MSDSLESPESFVGTFVDGTKRKKKQKARCGNKERLGVPRFRRIQLKSELSVGFEGPRKSMVCVIAENGRYLVLYLNGVQWDPRQSGYISRGGPNIGESRGQWWDWVGWEKGVGCASDSTRERIRIGGRVKTRGADGEKGFNFGAEVWVSKLRRPMGKVAVMAGSSGSQWEGPDRQGQFYGHTWDQGEVRASWKILFEVGLKFEHNVRMGGYKPWHTRLSGGCGRFGGSSPEAVGGRLEALAD
ncbi:hypothetical protein DFH09DRAFT_1079155 [Mycena vulgaris]|nr:hypothetical protein DFH09DRAFT_1079155 [Mycena vulgaris]